MENYYTGYTKVIDNKTYYFIKKYIVFPAKENIPPVLENYGMHTDFNKACGIAQINDPAIRQQILSEIEGNIQHAKVIDLNNTDTVNKMKAR
jgi:hypothetical protein